MARKRVWTYERRPSRGTSAATRPLHAHRREAMEQIARGAAAVRRRRAAIGRRGEAAAGERRERQGRSGGGQRRVRVRARRSASSRDLARAPTTWRGCRFAEHTEQRRAHVEQRIGERVEQCRTALTTHSYRCFEEEAVAQQHGRQRQLTHYNALEGRTNPDHDTHYFLMHY